MVALFIYKCGGANFVKRFYNCGVLCQTGAAKPRGMWLAAPVCAECVMLCYVLLVASVAVFILLATSAGTRIVASGFLLLYDGLVVMLACVG